ncbi:MAG TPA: hypothetical protein VIL30_22590 [Ramlibacter sp.]|jgi:hypothetical protein
MTITKTVAFACAAAVVFFAAGFLLPQPLNASPAAMAAPGTAASLEGATAVQGMADLFQAEKAGAAQSELPAQF